MRHHVTIEQHQDAWLAAFMWAHDYAATRITDGPKLQAWLEAQFSPEARRAIFEAARRKLEARIAAL